MSRPVAVITGAGRGIGRAVAEALSDVADLCLCARSQAELSVAAESLASRCRVLAVPCDVSDAAQVASLFAKCRETLGPVDWLVNNAGVVEIAPLQDLSEAQFDHVVGVNLKGPFLCTRAAYPDLVARRGRVVNVGSISGTLGTPRLSAYNASKWGVNGLTQSWAEELRDAGVLVAAVLPGSVDTQMLAQSGFPPEMEPADIARIVRFLLVEAPLAMTGSLVEAFG